MQFPPFYDPRKVGELYSPRFHEAMSWGRKLSRITDPHPSPEEQVPGRMLLGVDTLIGFMDRAFGELPVPGMTGDLQRAIELILWDPFLYDEIDFLFDCHPLLHIASAAWWKQNGALVRPNTPITLGLVRDGEIVPLSSRA